MVDVSIGSGMVAIGAGIAIGLSGLAAGWAEKDIGTAAVGAIAENPKNFGRSLVMTVIPETIVIFGLVIAFLLMGKI
jgi:V/A-type H+/Na+-transporting ATPase subunit K